VPIGARKEGWAIGTSEVTDTDPHPTNRKPPILSTPTRVPTRPHPDMRTQNGGRYGSGRELALALRRQQEHQFPSTNLSSCRANTWRGGIQEKGGAE
jgi:hypothetical protein